MHYVCILNCAELHVFGRKSYLQVVLNSPTEVQSTGDALPIWIQASSKIPCTLIALHLQDSNKRELQSSPDLQAAYSTPSYSLHEDLLLFATADNKPLSDKALAAAPLTLVPVGPRPLPVIGNFRCYASGPYKVFAYNCYANVFTPEKMAQWGDTVVLHLPNCSGGKDILPVSYSGTSI